LTTDQGEQESGTEEAGSSIGGVFFVAALMAAVALAGMVFQYSPPQPLPSLELRYWIPSADQLGAQRLRDEKNKEKVTWDGEERLLEAALTHFGYEEVRRGGKGVDAALRESYTQLEQRAHGYYGTRGRDYYRAVGLHLCDRFENALNRFLKDVQAGKVSIAEGYELSDGSSALALHGFAGTMLEDALRTGLVDRLGKATPESVIVMRYLFLTRWAKLIREITPESTLLSGLEIVTLWKWKVEAHAQLPLKERFEYAKRILRVDSTYPIHHVAGILLWRSGLGEEALLEVGLALDQNPESLELIITERFMRTQWEFRGEKAP
jgi:hypothetical protein